MAGIKDPILDLLTKLRTITVRKGDGQTEAPYVRIWNNQIAYDLDGQMEAFPKPAFFVEVVNNPTYEVLGQGFRSSDISFRIHIAHEFYNGTDGTYEQDLPVFDLRDRIIANLTGFILTGCGPLNAMAESQDFEHKNVYHYIIDFVCNFTDSKGSKYDPDHPEAYIDSPSPLELELNPVTIDQGPARTNKFIINTNNGLGSNTI